MTATMKRSFMFYGMKVEAHYYDRGTWIDPEERCCDIHNFSRQAMALHHETGELLRCKATINDTWFSTPATTDTQHGYITGAGSEDGKERWLEFRPHTDQTMTPAQWRRDYKRRCK